MVVICLGDFKSLTFEKEIWSPVVVCWKSLEPRSKAEQTLLLLQASGLFKNDRNIHRHEPQNHCVDLWGQLCVFVYRNSCPPEMPPLCPWHRLSGAPPTSLSWAPVSGFHWDTPSQSSLTEKQPFPPRFRLLINYLKPTESRAAAQNDRLSLCGWS